MSVCARRRRCGVLAAPAAVGALGARGPPPGGQRSCCCWRLEAKPTHALRRRWSHLRGRQGCRRLSWCRCCCRGRCLRGWGGGAVVGGGEGRACCLHGMLLLVLSGRTGRGARGKADAPLALVLAFLRRTARAPPCSLPCIEHGGSDRSLQPACFIVARLFSSREDVLRAGCFLLPTGSLPLTPRQEKLASYWTCSRVSSSERRIQLALAAVHARAVLSAAGDGRVYPKNKSDR